MSKKIYNIRVRKECGKCVHRVLLDIGRLFPYQCCHPKRPENASIAVTEDGILNLEKCSLRKCPLIKKYGV